MNNTTDTVGMRVVWVIGTCELRYKSETIVLTRGMRGAVEAVELDSEWAQLTIRWDTGEITDSILPESVRPLSPLEALAEAAE